MFVDPFAGKTSIGSEGAGGGAEVVVRVEVCDQPLAPPALAAFTRQ
jgi:hypothetical protein